jgi:hypothetical protein
MHIEGDMHFDEAAGSESGLRAPTGNRHDLPTF